MPIPDAIWQLLLANTQASGQSFNPWALGQAAQPQSGGSLEAAIAEARARLGGTYAPASVGGGAAPQPTAMFDGSGGGAGAGMPGPGVGQGYGYDPQSVNAFTNVMGLSLPGLPAAGGKALMGFLNQMAPVQQQLQAAFPFGVLTEEGPTPATIATRGPFGLPTGYVPNLELDQAARVDPQINPAMMNVQSFVNPFSPTAAGGPSPNPSIGVSANVPSGNFAPRANDPADAAGVGAPAGTGAPGTGPGDAAGAGGQAPYRGGYLDGARRKKKKVPEAHGGEFVMNASATDAYGPLLEEMNESIQPNEDFDKLLDRARKFWD